MEQENLIRGPWNAEYSFLHLKANLGSPGFEFLRVVDLEALTA